jgi:DNA end-binding protein Ku
MLEAREGRLVLVALRSANEVVGLEGLDLPAATETSRAAERALAEQLVAALDAPFDPKLLRDEYRERVEKLVAAKRSGRRLRVAEGPPPEPRGDLARALRESLRAAKGRRVAA